MTKNSVISKATKWLWCDVHCVTLWQPWRLNPLVKIRFGSHHEFVSYYNNEIGGTGSCPLQYSRTSFVLSLCTLDMDFSTLWGKNEIGALCKVTSPRVGSPSLCNAILGWIDKHLHVGCRISGRTNPLTFHNHHVLNFLLPYIIRYR